jgi:hypothetical protein
MMDTNSLRHRLMDAQCHILFSSFVLFITGHLFIELVWDAADTGLFCHGQETDYGETSKLLLHNLILFKMWGESVTLIWVCEGVALCVCLH